MAGRLPFETVLFDVDGTLINSNAAHAETWTQAFREHQIETDVLRIRALVGMGSDKLLPAAANISDESELGQAIAHRKKELFGPRIASLRPTNGARALVRFLRDHDVDVVIATSADDRELSALLQQANVEDLIPKRASKDDAASSKPDPDIVHAALQRSGADPARSVLVGDTPYDIQAAARAHVSTIALRCGGYWSDDDLRGAVIILDDPAALLDYWRLATAQQS